MVFCQKDANGIANSEDPERNSLIWVCTVCLEPSVRKLRFITVFMYIGVSFFRVLKEKEDEEIQQSFKLGAEQPSKKFCCKS